MMKTKNKSLIRTTNHFHTMHAIDTNESRMGIFRNIFIIMREDALHKLVLHCRLGFNHVSTIVRVEKELTRFRVG